MKYVEIGFVDPVISVTDGGELSYPTPNEGGISQILHLQTEQIQLLKRSVLVELPT
jgi:hypothetical protein